MAIHLKRNKQGKFDTTYSGFDAVAHEFGNTLERVKSVGKKVVKSVAKRYEDYDKAQARKELDDISRGFGSPENYEKLYPETKKRNDMLRKKAGY